MFFRQLLFSQTLVLLNIRHQPIHIVFFRLKPGKSKTDSSLQACLGTCVHTGKMALCEIFLEKIIEACLLILTRHGCFSNGPRLWQALLSSFVSRIKKIDCSCSSQTVALASVSLQSTDLSNLWFQKSGVKGTSS